jgi:hypothetical protein
MATSGMVRAFDPGTGSRQCGRSSTPRPDLSTTDEPDEHRYRSFAVPVILSASNGESDATLAHRMGAGLPAIGYRSSLIGDSTKAQPFDADPNKNREQWQSALPSPAKHANHAKWTGRKRTQKPQRYFLSGSISFSTSDGEKPLAHRMGEGDSSNHQRSSRYSPGRIEFTAAATSS